MATYDSPSALADDLPSIPFDRTIQVVRYVAREVLSDIDSTCCLVGSPVEWVAQVFEGDRLVEKIFRGVEGLAHACQWGATVYGMSRTFGRRMTPTFSLVGECNPLDYYSPIVYTPHVAR
jgi:hypothetical protein